MSEHGADDNSQKGSQYLLHLYRGSDFLLKEQVVEARQELEEASRIDPDDPKGLSLLALVYFRLDEFERAQQIYELLVARYPEEAPLRVNLGLVYMKQGRAEAALDEMLHAVEFDPSHQRAYGYLGLLYSEAGEHERARVAFAKAGQDAMVQRMEELLAMRLLAEASPEPAGPLGRSPADTQEGWAAPPPPRPREPHDAGQPLALPSQVSGAPVAGSPLPFGTMTPMMSDAMTQPVAVAVDESRAEVQTEDPVVDPFASWGAELDGIGEAPATSPAPDLGPAAGAGDGLGAPTPPPSVDWSEGSASGSGTPQVPSTAPLAMPGEADALYPMEGLSAEREPEGDIPSVGISEADVAASPPDLSDPVASLDGAFQRAAAPTESAPWTSDAAPEPWVAQNPPVVGGSFIEASDVSEALDHAVGPDEPWPAITGAQMASGTPEEGSPPTIDSRMPVAGAGAREALQGASGKEGVEAMPIFAFATTDLVDLGARHERMDCTPDGLLVFSFEEEGYFRAESLVAEVGDLRFEPVYRRAKGANTEALMEDRRGRFLKARGEGLLLCSPGADRLVVLDLFDDFIYVRSEYLFAFESTLHWENGKIRGQLGAIPLLHVRGEGRLALACEPGLRKLRLVPDQPALVAEAALVGWVGRVIPQTVPRPAVDGHAPLGAPLLRCEGEGVLLVLPGRVASGSWNLLPVSG